MAYQYAASLQMDDVQLLLGYLKGQPPDVNNTMRACIGILSYGAGQLFPTPPVLPAGVEPMAAPEVIKHLELAVASGHKAALSLPWETIVPFLANLLMELLRRRRSPVPAPVA